MERFLKDLFATADENELAEFDKELESIVNSCPGSDERIISAVQEKATTDGDPVKRQPAANVKIKSLLPAVIAAVLVFALFAGLFSRANTKRETSPQPGTRVTESLVSEAESRASDSSGEDELAFQIELDHANTEASIIASIVDEFIVRVKAGEIKTMQIPVGYLTADLSDPEDEGSQILRRMTELITEPVTITDESGVSDTYNTLSDKYYKYTLYILPDEGEVTIKISEELFLIGVQYRSDQYTDAIGCYCCNEYAGAINIGEFGTIEPIESDEMTIYDAYYDIDAEYYSMADIGDILSGGNGSDPAPNEYLKKNVELMNSIGVGGVYIPAAKNAFNSSTRSGLNQRIDTWLAGYSKNYPYLTLYIAAKTNDGLPFDYEGVGDNVLESGYSVYFSGDDEINSGRIRWYSEGEYAITKLQLEIPLDSFEEMTGKQLMLNINNMEYNLGHTYYHLNIASSFVFLDKEPPQGETSILISGSDELYGGDGSIPDTPGMTFGCGFDNNEELTELLDSYLKDVAQNYDPAPQHYYDSMGGDGNYIQIYRNGLMITIPETSWNTVFIGSLLYMPTRNETVNFAFEIRKFMKEHKTEGKDIYQYNRLGEIQIK